MTAIGRGTVLLVNTKGNGQNGNSGRVRIVVADDHAVVRLGISGLLSRNPAWEVCGEAENGEEAIAKVEELKPDLVVLDVTMPVMNGITAAREIRRLAPAIKIVILTMHDSTQLEAEARAAGANSIVKKTNVADALVREIERLVDSPAKALT